MKMTSEIEERFDTIRDKIYEKIKDMSPRERTAYYNAIAEEARAKHNFHVVKSAVNCTSIAKTQ